LINPNASLPQVLMRYNNGVFTYYIYGAGLLYQVTESATATNTLTYHYDYRGSTVALTDDSGKVTDRIEYSAYGLTTYRTGTNDTPFLFNGRYGVQTDPNGLLYMRARYYSPYLCRFINADPSGFAGGMNWYAYANGNPISLIDPFGLCAEGWGGRTAGWITENIGDVFNSVSTTSTTANFVSSMFGTFANGLGDLLRLGQGVSSAMDANNGWDVAIGITQDIGRAAGITTLVGGPVAGLARGSVAAESGGRLGSDLTRSHVADVAAEMESRGWKITGGGGKLPEEYLRGPNGRLGSSYPDITATKNGRTLRVNTVDTYSDGITPTAREAANAARIRAQTPGDHLLLVPIP
jgi:RHS repeat-associated protein